MSEFDINHISLSGKLVSPCELRHTRQGRPVTNLRLKSIRTWRGPSGEEQSEEVFIDVKAFGACAELICDRMQVGRGIHVEGRLTVNTWDGALGEFKEVAVVAERVKFLSGSEANRAGLSWNDAATSKPRHRRDCLLLLDDDEIVRGALDDDGDWRDLEDEILEGVTHWANFNPPADTQNGKEAA